MRTLVGLIFAQKSYSSLTTASTKALMGLKLASSEHYTNPVIFSTWYLFAHETQHH